MEGNKFCNNCGNELKPDAKFCDKCGADIKPAPAEKPAEAPVETENFTDKIAKSNPFPALFKKTKEFVLKNKKPVIITASALAVLVVGIVIFNAVWDFTKLEWDVENFSDIKLDITSGTVLNVGVKAEDKEKNEIKEVEYSVSAGEIETDGLTAVWKLPDENGEYEISVKAPSGKTITKKIKKVKIEDDKNKQLGGLIVEEVDDETADNDGDGLTNADEKKRGTNPDLADTDMDGLIDSHEINETKTDPNKADTDGDGLSDGDEIALGLDPNKADSKGDGKKDGERDLSYSFEENGVNVTIAGQGNVASSSVDIIKNSNFKDIEGLSDTIYNFSTSGKLKNAKVTIKYDEHNLISNNIDESKLTLYYLNDETKNLEKVDGVVDVNANTITVELKHFSKYVLGNADVEKNTLSANIMFVIDNSVSMYTESQVHAAGYEEVTGADGNDSSFKRLSLTKDMIDKLTGNYKFGVAEFSGNYVNLQKFTDSQSSAKTAVEKMRSKWNSNANGTDIATSMTSGVNEFTKDDGAAHYMIFLTDGKDTSETLSSRKSSIIDSAKSKDVKICTIGLGDEIDTAILNDISEKTGCDYYNANDSSALDEIYNIIGSDINFGYVDTDADNKTDGMIIADSGFIVTRDGFSFGNYGSDKSENGHCYGMAYFAQLYYMGDLPTSLEYKKINGLTGLVQGHPEANAYSLSSNSYFRGSGSLYDFKFTTPGLKLLLQDEIPADYRDRIEDHVWKIKEEYVTNMENVGINVYTRDARDIEKEQDSSIEKVQGARVRENNTTLASNAKSDENDVLDAIWRLFILQFDGDKRISFESNPDKAWDQLVSDLQSGKPTIFAINSNHAINATKIIQDNNDPNKFKIAVYNNNFPGKTQYIEVTRTKIKSTLNPTKWLYTWTNDYAYSFRYDSNIDDELEDTTIEIREPNLR